MNRWAIVIRRLHRLLRQSPSEADRMVHKGIHVKVAVLHPLLDLSGS
jgi:hypothetical protein